MSDDHRTENSTSICLECRMGGGAHKATCSRVPRPLKKFADIEQLRHGPLAACIGTTGECIFIEADTSDGGDAEICLDMAEARALRDWLTEALK